MVRIDNGGTAFPSVIERERNVKVDEDTFTFIDTIRAPGMSMRDWFAGQIAIPDNLSIDQAKALAGREFPVRGRLQYLSPVEILSIQQFWADAHAAYRGLHADAMIAERQARSAKNG